MKPLSEEAIMGALAVFAWTAFGFGLLIGLEIGLQL